MSVLENKKYHPIGLFHSDRFFEQRRTFFVLVFTFLGTICGLWMVNNGLLLLRTKVQRPLFMRGFSLSLYEYNKTLHLQRQSAQQCHQDLQVWYQEWQANRILPWTLFDDIVQDFSSYVRLIDYVYPVEGVAYFRAASRSLPDFMVWLSENNRSEKYVVQKVTMIDQDEVMVICHIQKNNKK